MPKLLASLPVMCTMMVTYATESLSLSHQHLLMCFAHVIPKLDQLVCSSATGKQHLTAAVRAQGHHQKGASPSLLLCPRGDKPCRAQLTAAPAANVFPKSLAAWSPFHRVFALVLAPYCQSRASQCCSAAVELCHCHSSWSSPGRPSARAAGPCRTHCFALDSQVAAAAVATRRNAEASCARRARRRSCCCCRGCLCRRHQISNA